ncbi:MAG TPA: diaminopimelate decarboxylase [Roseiflexaceae bacterium]|nr:diaminopimelate decarboxylase [Roseiflexaceae bacterium]
MTLPEPRLWPDTASVAASGRLTIGGCDTVELARAYGTPLYLLDEATFRASCRAYRAALAQHYLGASAHYASKALLNSTVVRLLAEEGLGLDVVSGGELYVALRAGFPAERIHLHGNAKTRAELEQALMAGVGKIVVDTFDELELLAQLTAGRAEPQAIMLRLSPDIAADTHAHIQTGSATSKFGLPLDALDVAAARILDAPGLRLAGLHTHLGSQILDYSPIAQAIGVLLDCAARLRDEHGLTVAEISPGGGLGTPYTADQPTPDIGAYIAAVAQAMRAGCAARRFAPLSLVVEPGRSIVGRAGVALYQIVATKPLPGDGRWVMADEEQSHRPSRYLHIDGGMADNIRPALYGARYTALLADRAAEPATELVHIAGRYCESGDVLIRDIFLPQAALGEILAVATAGAYTLSMANNYNLVPRPALLLVADGKARVIQRRETYADLVARDE